MDFTQGGQWHFTASIDGNTAYMDVQTPPLDELALPAWAPLSRDLWHCHLCHIGACKLDQAIKHSVADGLKLDTQSPLTSLCEPCIHGKQHCDPFPHKASHWATQPLEHIHSDLHEVPYLTMSGYCYWVTFIDDYSRYCWIYLLHKKSDTLPAFKLFKVLVEKQYGYAIDILHKDKGREYTGKEWDAFMGEHGIRRENTVRATPQQNEVLKGRIGSLLSLSQLFSMHLSSPNHSGVQHFPVSTRCSTWSHLMLCLSGSMCLGALCLSEPA
jgi:hypothetical protein